MSVGTSTTPIADSRSAVNDVPVLVIQVESPNVIYVRKSPLSAKERELLRAFEDYCGRIHLSSSRWGTSLNERQLNVGHKYFALDGRQGGTQWRRGLLTNVVTVRGGHRACVYLIDEARSVDVPLNHLLPMPDTYGLHPPLLRKVIISGIRPCSLITDDLTCKTSYGPTSTWDLAAIQYAKKLFLCNSSLSDTRLCHIRIDSETRLCFADLSFRVEDRTISSYAEHLMKLHFAAEDDANNSFALQASLESDKIGRGENSATVPLPPFRSDSPLTLIDADGNVIRCYKPGTATGGAAHDSNNNQSSLMQNVPTLEPAASATLPETRASLEGTKMGMQITFQPASPTKTRSVQI